MKKVKLIYNPYSGEKNFKYEIDIIIREYQKHGYIIVPRRISYNANFKNFTINEDLDYDHVLIAGGDGTVNRVINEMILKGINSPIGLFPIGTANDFSKMIGMSRNTRECCRRILNSEAQNVDLGRINGKYFINVASGGLFTDVSQKIDDEFKDSMGKVAYYLQGIYDMRKFKSFRITMEHDRGKLSCEAAFFLVFNGRTAGNINLAYKSNINDGELDVIVMTIPKNFSTMVGTTIDFLKGDHLDKSNNSIEYFKTSKLKIKTDSNIISDVDGEAGPKLPLEIECIKDAIKIKYIIK